MMLSDVCLSVAYIGPKSRIERPRKIKIGTDVAHVTCDSETTFKVKRSKVKVTRPLYSPPCWRVRQLQRWAWETAATLPSARPRAALRHPRGERGIPWRPPARLQLVLIAPYASICDRSADRSVIENRLRTKLKSTICVFFTVRLKHPAWVVLVR